MLVLCSVVMGGCSKSNKSTSAVSPAGSTAAATNYYQQQAYQRQAMAQEAEAAKEKAVAEKDAALPKGNSDTPLDQYQKLVGPKQLMGIFWNLVGQPVPYELLADEFSGRYKSESDVFKKKDMLQALKPRINDYIAKMKNVRYLAIPGDANLDGYNMGTKQFPVEGMDSGLTLSFNNMIIGEGDFTSYNIQFTNAPDFKSLSVADEAKARKIESLRQKYNGLQLVYYVYTQAADTSHTDKTFSTGYMTLKAHIVKITLLDAKGHELATW